MAREWNMCGLFSIFSVFIWFSDEWSFVFIVMMVFAYYKIEGCFYWVIMKLIIGGGNKNAF